MTSSDIKVWLKNSEGKKEMFFDSEFGEKIKSEESIWSLEDNKYLDLFIEKGQERIWKQAFRGHKEIDTKKVDNSKKLGEFDKDTQSALGKIIIYF